MNSIARSVAVCLLTVLSVSMAHASSDLGTYYAPPLLNYEGEELPTPSSLKTNILSGQKEVRDAALRSVVYLEASRRGGLKFIPSEQVPGSKLETVFTREALEQVLRSRGTAVNLSEEQIQQLIEVHLPYLNEHKVRGSGVVFTRDGLILTNAHVIYDPIKDGASDQIILSFTEDTAHPPNCLKSARVLHYNLDFDLAVLQQDSDLDENCQPNGANRSTTRHTDFLQMRGLMSDASIVPEIGEQLYAIGYPTIGGAALHLTEGLVSGYLFANNDQGEELIIGLKTTADVNPGNSGGAAIDSDGFLVGIPTFIAVSSESGSKLNVVIPVTSIINWLYGLYQDHGALFYVGPHSNDRLDMIIDAAIREKNNAASSETQAEPVPQVSQSLPPVAPSVSRIDYITASADRTDQLQNLSIVLANRYGENLNCFTDVSSGVPNKIAICWAKSQEVIGGYPDGTFGTYSALNRAELVKILVEATGQKPSLAQYRGCFPDVNDEWFAPYVCYAKSMGYVSGYPDGTFQGWNSVNRAEALKMMFNIFRAPLPASAERTYFSDVSTQDWFAPYVQYAKEKNFLDPFDSNRQEYRAWEPIYRGSMIESVFRMMTGLAYY